MKILAIEKENEGIFCDNEKEILENEAKEIRRLINKGVVKEIYFTERNIAVIILEAENICKAHEILNSLPLVTKGLSEFDIMELQPYTGFDRISKPEAVMAD